MGGHQFALCVDIESTERSLRPWPSNWTIIGALSDISILFMRKNPTEMKWIWVVFFRRAFHRNQLLNITRAKSVLDRIMREDNIVSFIISDIESTTKCAITEVLTTRSVSWSPKGFLIADVRLKSFINLHFIVGIRFSSELCG